MESFQHPCRNLSEVSPSSEASLSSEPSSSSELSSSSEMNHRPRHRQALVLHPAQIRIRSLPLVTMIQAQNCHDCYGALGLGQPPACPLLGAK